MKIKLIFFISLVSFTTLNASIYKCNTTEEIISALKEVKAGDEIVIEPGTYAKTTEYNSAYFYSIANGTVSAPIVMKSSSNLVKPKLQGNNMYSGAVLRIIGDNWVVENLDLSVGLKGLVFDNSTNNKVINCVVHKIGNEAIHIRDGSNYTVIDNCKIYDTGNVNPGYGEGIYIGTDRKHWSKYNPNCNNTLIKNCEIGPNVRAEAVDIKEGTQETIVKNNKFNGLGISGVNSAESFISIKGVRSTIQNNVFETKGEANILNGVTTVFRNTPLSGYENSVYDNVFNMNTSKGNIVKANSGTYKIHAWNNTRNPSGNNYSKAVINSAPKSDSDEGTIIYEDHFDSSKSRFLGSALKNISVSVPKKGEVKLEMKSGATLPKYSPIMYRFPKDIDFSKNLKIIIRVKASDGFKLRFDLHDGVKATNGSNGRVTQVIPSGLDNWTDLEFTYSDASFSDNNVNKSAIKRINIQLDSGKENFPGELFVDFIKIVDTSTSGEVVKSNISKESTINTEEGVGNSKKYVILKMDDLRSNYNRSYNKNWGKFIKTIQNYNIKAGLGIVAVDLSNKASQKFKDSLTSFHNSKYFEIWHHGWDHKKNNYPPENNNRGEFSGTSYEFQKDHFENSIKYAKSELGIVMKTFGAPYNQTDDVFSKIIKENQDIKVWLYGNNKNSYNGLVLSRGSRNLLESSTGVVSFDSFLRAFENSKTPYLVLQGHPGKWDDESFAQFDQVITYLKAQNVIFVLPYEYYEMTNDKTKLK